MQRTALSTALLCAIALSACQSVDQNTATTKNDAVPSQAQPDRQQDEALADKQVAAVSNPSPRAVAKGRLEKEAAEEKSADALGVANIAMPRERRTSGMIAPAPLMALNAPPPAQMAAGYYSQSANTEKYAAHDDNPVHRTREQPVSTFSIDVNTGSYSNVRRMINQGMRPPADAVRAEEMINYFSYGHPGPKSLDVPFRVSTELAPAPWNGKHQLLNLQGHSLHAFSLLLHEMTPRDALILQQVGLGEHRLLGCGVFVPHKSAAAV